MVVGTHNLLTEVHARNNATPIVDVRVCSRVCESRRVHGAKINDTIIAYSMLAHMMRVRAACVLLLRSAS